MVSAVYSTSDGTARAGIDYITTTGTVTFSNGDTAPKTFNVPIIDNGVKEGSKTVNLKLSNPTGGATLGSPSKAVLTMIDTN